MTIQFNLFETNSEEPLTPVIVPPSPIVLSKYRHTDEKVSEWEINSEFRDAHVWSELKTSRWYLDQDKFWFWDNLIESGKSYLVGDIPTSAFLRKYSSLLSKWQRWAYMWSIENPGKILYVETKTHHWRVYLRGEYVEFALPHQSFGGERHYITRNGKTKVLVNED